MSRGFFCGLSLIRVRLAEESFDRRLDLGPFEEMAADESGGVAGVELDRFETADLAKAGGDGIGELDAGAEGGVVGAVVLALNDDDERARGFVLGEEGCGEEGKKEATAIGS